MSSSPARSRIAVLLLVLAATPTALAAETDLRWKLEKGDELHYRVIRDVWSTQKLPEQMAAMTGSSEMTVGSRTETITRFVVDEVDDEGVAHLLATMLAVKLDSDQGPMGGKVSWDSTAEGATRPTNPVALITAAPLGRETSFRLSPAGQVSDVQGYDEAVAEVLESLQENPYMAMMANQLRDSAGNEAMEQLLSAQFGVLPDEPVEPGATWERTQSSSLGASGVSVVSKQVFTLAGIAAAGDEAREVAALDISIEVTQDDSADAAGGGNPMAAMMKAKLEEGQGSGKASFDVPAGRLLASTTESEMKITATMGPQMQISAEARQQLDVEMLAGAPDLPPPPVITGAEEGEDEAPATEDGDDEDDGGDETPGEDEDSDDDSNG